MFPVFPRVLGFKFPELLSHANSVGSYGFKPVSFENIDAIAAPDVYLIGDIHGHAEPLKRLNTGRAYFSPSGIEFRTTVGKRMFFALDDIYGEDVQDKEKLEFSTGPVFDEWENNGRPNQPYAYISNGQKETTKEREMEKLGQL